MACRETVPRETPPGLDAGRSLPFLQCRKLVDNLQKSFAGNHEFCGVVNEMRALGPKLSLRLMGEEKMLDHFLGRYRRGLLT